MLLQDLSTEYFYYNNVTGEITYLYDSLEDSFDAEKCTVVLATNASYQSFHMFDVFGVLAGFQTYSMPTEVSVLISGAFWVLLILTVVKLIVG